MKKTIKFLGFALIAGALFMSCEGPAGPAGENGTDGKDGVDGNLTCLECHSSVVMNAIETQFELTKHSEGTSFAYAGTRSSCAPCHSSDAYDEFVASGMLIAGNGTSLQCETCHANHTSLEDDISAPIKDISEVVAVVDDSKTFNHGKGNICATCHQARTYGSSIDKYTTATTVEYYVAKASTSNYAIYKALVDAGDIAMGPAGFVSFDNGTDSLAITFDVPTTYVVNTSTHAGPHHGPQANMFAGIVGYPTTGTAFTRANHTDCVSCHLNDTTEAGGFGHAFSPDINQCDACHGTAVDVEGIMADTHERLDPIIEALAALNMVTIADGVTSNYTIADVSPQVFSETREHFQAFWNTISILEDKSFGVHNKVYTDQMLTAAETNLGLK